MRISRHQMFMEIAQVVSKRSTCFRENVGCILVRDNKIVSIGYNGPKAGEEPCDFHPEGKCQRSIHAEINAIKFAMDNNEPMCDMYVTHLPCPNCTKFIVQSGIISNVFFATIYGNTQPVYEILDNQNIRLLRILPSGSITSHDRSEVYNDFK